MKQPRDEQIRKGRYAELDPGWVWTRSLIALLLEEGFKSEKACIPYECLAVACEVLFTLTEDPDPTPDRE